MRALINEALQSGIVARETRREHDMTWCAGLAPDPNENVSIPDLFRPVFHWCHQSITIPFGGSGGLPDDRLEANAIEAKELETRMAVAFIGGQVVHFRMG